MDHQFIWDALQLAATLVVGFGSVRYANYLLHDDSLRKDVDACKSDIAYIKGVLTGLFRIGNSE